MDEPLSEKRVSYWLKTSDTAFQRHAGFTIGKKV